MIKNYSVCLSFNETVKAHDAHMYRQTHTHTAMHTHKHSHAATTSNTRVGGEGGGLRQSYSVVGVGCGEERSAVSLGEAVCACAVGVL